MIANSMTGTFEYEKGDKRDVPDFNVFFRYYATYPYYSDAVWYLTQMRRWGQIAGAARPMSGTRRRRRRCICPDVYLQAARLLVEEGKAKTEDFPFGHRRLPRADASRIHRRHRVRRPQAQCLHRKLPIGLKRGQVIESGNVADQAEGPPDVHVDVEHSARRHGSGARSRRRIAVY